MKSRIASITVIFFIICLIMTGCDGKEHEKYEMLIAAAASLKNPLEDIKTCYLEINPEVNLNFTFAGSGSLEQQIRQGAPVDIFISAAEKQMDALSKDGYILDNSRVDLLGNQVVLIVPKDSILDITCFQDIGKATVIALGSPDSVPVGSYAEEVFTNLGIQDEVYEKATFGKDVIEVLAWVSSGNADAGVVYRTDAIQAKGVIVVSDAPEGSHNTIRYPAAVIKNTKKIEIAQEFLNFLQTDKAREIFQQHGFAIIEN